jgi:quinoprotein glucose dehydrogenase
LSTAAIELASGFEIGLFAAEPSVANPVAICLDDQGRIYVCETFRQRKGVEDNRDHMDWLDDDLAAQSVEDRVNYFKRHLKDGIADYTRQDDRIRLLEDHDGDGRADRETVYAHGFNGIEEGTGAGVLAYGNTVYYTCIPRLWSLRDTDGDGKADRRSILHDGFGVRVAFRGHDLHGLCLGPDGRLYFSVGDRGYNVLTNEQRRLADPETGAVFRCEMDGSHLEVFATGLRNPQELAFDDFGNLFTGDNNSDSGDLARWVHLVEGADSGWRMAFQYLPDRGPWNQEQLWRPYHQGQAAYIVPPVANIADGPSGVAYYPGTGLAEFYRGNFFLCDFRGDAGRSGIRTFKLKARGAGFELVEPEIFLWNCLVTDVDFGPDGAMYVSDWVEGWDGAGKGRIYRIVNPEADNKAEVAQVKTLISGGMRGRGADELGALLTHLDRRVRQGAQLELVNQRHVATLARVARTSDHQLARLHAIWGLGQLGRLGVGEPEVTDAPLALLDDPDVEVRAACAKVLGEARVARALGRLTGALADPHPRVRYFAALSLGKLGRSESVDPLFQMLQENADEDPVLRHAAVMGLAGTADIARLTSAATHPSRSARLGALLALRRLGHTNASLWLNDSDSLVALEAARAIHDVPIDEALPLLAAQITNVRAPVAQLRRVLNANFRLGQPEHAQALATFAATEGAPAAMRLEALSMLAQWASPPQRDRVLGMWRPIPPHERAYAAAAMHQVLSSVCAPTSPVRIGAARVAASLGLAEVGPVLHDILRDPAVGAPARATVLSDLHRLDDANLADAVSAALKDNDARVRTAARSVLAETDPESAVAELGAAVESQEPLERQRALETLGGMRLASAEQLVSACLDRLLAGQIPLDTTLDLVHAAKRMGGNDLQAKLEQYEAAQPKDDPLARYRGALAGGNAERGRRIFFERISVSCLRCHRIGEDGGIIGPDLTKIGASNPREYLLESLVAPDRQIAKGFETVVVATDDGRVYTGVLREETANVLELITDEGLVIHLDTETIEARRRGKSAMPEDLMEHLSMLELRDLVEFLAGLK